jgi:hypothetical protein
MRFCGSHHHTVRQQPNQKANVIDTLRLEA